MNYTKEIAKVEEVRLYIQDHGMLTVDVKFQTECGVQSIPGYQLDTYNKETKNMDGTAFGMTFVLRLIEAFGVRDFADIKGKTCYVLYPEDKSGFTSKIVGVENFGFERGGRFIFDELREQFYGANV